jgi:hypothetical protein
VSRLQVSIFAFTAAVFGVAGDVAGLAIVAGLADAGVLAVVVVVLVSFELQPVVITTRQKITA